MPENSSPWTGLALWAALSVLAVLSVRLLDPPSVRPADAPPTLFSAERALRHVEALARQPHPVGSAEHAVVSDYIVGELTRLGLSPEVQQTTGVRTTRGTLLAAPVRNIVVRMPGTGDGPALLLTAHYDSISTSPGASDNASSVAALLEALRALRERPSPRGDLIALFTDGEEAGLLGAQVFVDEHRWASRVGLVLNFEARGTHGPAALFETGAANGRLVREFLDAAPRPVASSLVTDVYRHLPNETDLTIFREAGLAGLNFAYAAGLTHYHTMLDDLEHLDPRSLQQQGDYALTLALRFGVLDLDGLREPDAVFFNLFGPLAVSYPRTWTTPLTALTGLLLVTLTIVGLRRRTLSGRVLWGLLALVSCLLVVAGLVTLSWWCLVHVHRGYQWFVQRDSYNSGLYIAAFAALAVGITAWIQDRFRRRVALCDMAVGGLWVVWLCLLATALWLPGGSYLFVWPLLFGTGGGALMLASRTLSGPSPSVAHQVALAASAVPAVLLLVPTVKLLFILTGMLAPGVVVAPVVLLVALLLPQFELLPGRFRRWIPLIGVAACAVGVAAGSATSGFDARRPRQNSICYVLNQDTGRATWVSLDPAPDAWTSQFLGQAAAAAPLRDQIPWAAREFLQDTAPAAPLAPARVEVVDEQTGSDGKRRVTLRVRSARPTSLLAISVGSEMEVSSVGFADRTVVYSTTEGAPAPPRRVLSVAGPERGLELVLTMLPAEPVRLNVVDISNGLPALPDLAIRPRPEHMISKPIPWFTDSTLVSKSFVIPPG